VKRTHKRNSTNRSKIKPVVWNSQPGHNSITGEGFSSGHTAYFKLPAHAPFRLSLEYERANGLLLQFSFRLATINFDKQCSRNVSFQLVQPHREPEQPPLLSRKLSMSQANHTYKINDIIYG
jgi:hypothetical protein